MAKPKPQLPKTFDVLLYGLYGPADTVVMLPNGERWMIVHKTAHPAMIRGRYAQARVNDSWKGGGDPANEPAIEYNLKSTKAVLRAIITEELNRGTGRGSNAN